MKVLSTGNHYYSDALERKGKEEVKIGGRSKVISIGLNRTGNAKGRRIVLWPKTSVTSLSRRTAG